MGVSIGTPAHDRCEFPVLPSGVFRIGFTSAEVGSPVHRTRVDACRTLTGGVIGDLRCLLLCVGLSSSLTELSRRFLCNPPRFLGSGIAWSQGFLRPYLPFRLLPDACICGGFRWKTRRCFRLDVNRPGVPEVLLCGLCRIPWTVHRPCCWPLRERSWFGCRCPRRFGRGTGSRRWCGSLAPACGLCQRCPHGNDHRGIDLICRNKGIRLPGTCTSRSSPSIFPERVLLVDGFRRTRFDVLHAGADVLGLGRLPRYFELLKSHAEEVLIRNLCGLGRLPYYPCGLSLRIKKCLCLCLCLCRLCRVGARGALWPLTRASHCRVDLGLYLLLGQSRRCCCGGLCSCCGGLCSCGGGWWCACGGGWCGTDVDRCAGGDERVRPLDEVHLDVDEFGRPRVRRLPGERIDRPGERLVGLGVDYGGRDRVVVDVVGGRGHQMGTGLRRQDQCLPVLEHRVLGVRHQGECPARRVSPDLGLGATAGEVDALPRGGQHQEVVVQALEGRTGLGSGRRCRLVRIADLLDLRSRLGGRQALIRIRLGQRNDRDLDILVRTARGKRALGLGQGELGSDDCRGGRVCCPRTRRSSA